MQHASPDHSSIPDVVTDASGEKLARAATIGRGVPVLAFDVGGTDIKSALFDADGTALGLRRTPTPVSGGAEGLMERLAELADELKEQHPLVVPEAVGVVVPGIVDAESGIAVFSSNLGWRGAPIRDLASARFGMPVAFDHDVRAASWAERVLGGAREYANSVVLIIGTGIAGALLIDGRPYMAGGYAGEIGHSPIGEWPCPCGARGCLEAVASAGAISRRYAEATGVSIGGAKEVISRVAAGDEVAGQIWNEALDALTLAIAQLTAVIAPDAVVIGGGLSRAGDALFDELRTRLADRLSFHRIPQLVPAELSGNAGILGSALRARDAAEGKA
ncbi:Predicted N-acetyl-glucosamine kinase 2, ROK family [Microbacterium esteraromaticum]|uniref:Predicted N-acetyl-glucosamine kinase 2, ROK family n=1 Tax=Microbacterium esteraromaticum TaxID=57043 RepID=A0A1R4K223_9MICO|nr:ROK family protein [Microbacterium esteraromaticum]SJN38377.1 Predicted N-acetyl-glucosamine kinase 2, ROK family [Microbacterium esteraromaticum]